MREDGEGGMAEGMREEGGNKTEGENRGEGAKKEREQKAGSVLRFSSKKARTLAFLLFTVSFSLGAACAGLCVYMAKHSFYKMNSSSVVERVLYSRAIEKAQQVRDYLNRWDLEGAKAYCDRGNFDIEVWRYERQGEDDIYIWSSFDGRQAQMNQESYAQIPEVLEFYNADLPAESNHLFKLDEDYLFLIYIDLDFPLDDDLRMIGRGALMLYRVRYQVTGAMALCLLLCLASLGVLVRGAWRRTGREGAITGVLARLPFDLLTLLFAGGAAACCYFIYDSMYYRYRLESFSFLPTLAVCGLLLGILCALYFTELAIRLKQGGILRRMLAAVFFRKLGRGAVWVAGEVPTTMITLVIFLGICALELAVGRPILEFVAFTNRPAEAIGQTALLWGAEKIVFFAALLYVASICKRLLKASRALAEGQKDYRVDTRGMFGDFRRHGENLNSIGQGISLAVEEQMKSERLKTELITNVSHDLKTPLTSIINYAELICGEDTENEKLAEYAEVLFRQSKRLKKLLEDLIEASKATTGSIEVNLEPCEAGVLLAQAVGEYQHRLKEKELELIVRQPEEPVEIMADGRHLWRVFDNLLNNICKYSQEYSRVFLSIEVKDGAALLIFRNMSKYMLDVPPQELAERFVRGDKSRHMEGSGLGLSIAESLTRLQGGRMEIVTDGDLFKVILSFAVLG